MAASADKKPAPAAKSSGTPFIIGMLASGLLAAGAGAFFAMQISGLVKQVAEKKDTHVPVAASIAKVTPAGSILKPLPPVVTNLAEPERTWLRLECAIVLDALDAKNADLIAAEIAEDITSFLHSVTLAQIHGSSGFQNLREDLMERARVRTGGKVRQLLIQTLIFE